MPLSTWFLVLATCAGLGTSWALPAEIQARAPGDTRANPIRILIDCSGGPAVCNADCYAILCLAAPNPVQRNEHESDEQRRRSGYKVFRNDEEKRLSQGIDIPDFVLDITGRSGEESIMANTVQGGEGEILFPTQVQENIRVGASVGGQLTEQNVGELQWYFKIFTNYPPGSALYCDALQQDHPNHEVCPRGDKPKTDPSWTAVIRKLAKGPRGKFLFHQMNFDEGDRWTGKFWDNGKREIVEPTKQEEKSG